MTFGLSTQRYYCSNGASEHSSVLVHSPVWSATALRGQEQDVELLKYHTLLHLLGTAMMGTARSPSVARPKAQRQPCNPYFGLIFTIFGLASTCARRVRAVLGAFRVFAGVRGPRFGVRKKKKEILP